MGAGNIYTPVSWTTTDDVNSTRFAFLQNVDDATQGVRLQFTKSEEIFALNGVYVGTLVPAVYLPFTADSTDESVQNNLGRQYYRVNSGYVAWDLPAGSPTCDKIIVYYVGVNLGGSVKLQIDTVDVVGQTVDTDTGGATDYELSTTLTVAGGVAAGQEIRLVRIAGDSRIRHIVAYDSDGTVGADSERIIIGSETSILATNQSMEWAYDVAAADGTTKWVGGILHQGGVGNCTQVLQSPPVETINIDGAGANDFTLGYHQGTSVLWNRITDVDYDGGPTIIATADETYTFTTQALSFTNIFNPEVLLDRDATYVSMLPMHLTCLASAPDVGYVAELTDSAGTLSVSTTNTVVSMWGNTANARATIELILSPSITSHFVDSSVTHRKVYWDIGAADDIAINASWTGSWELTYHLGTAPSPVAATDVEDGVSYHGGLRTGDVELPSEGVVTFGNGYGSLGSEFQGAYIEVEVGSVRDGTTFGNALEQTGIFEWPDEDEVESGVGYGASGLEFTGTLVAAVDSDIVFIETEVVFP